MILCDARRFGRTRWLHAVCVLLCSCAIPFAVGCKGSKAPETTQPTPAATTGVAASPKASTQEQPTNAVANPAKGEEYRELTAKDGLNCGALIASMTFSFGDTPPSGQLTGFECLNNEKKTVRIKLKSTKLVHGKIETADFGTIRMKHSNGTSADYAMTETQVKNLKAFLGF